MHSTVSSALSSASSSFPQFRGPRFPRSSSSSSSFSPSSTAVRSPPSRSLLSVPNPRRRSLSLQSTVRFESDIVRPHPAPQPPQQHLLHAQHGDEEGIRRGSSANNDERLG